MKQEVELQTNVEKAVERADQSRLGIDVTSSVGRNEMLRTPVSKKPVFEELGFLRLGEVPEPSDVGFAQKVFKAADALEGFVSHRLSGT